MHFKEKGVPQYLNGPIAEKAGRCKKTKSRHTLSIERAWPVPGQYVANTNKTFEKNATRIQVALISHFTELGPVRYAPAYIFASAAAVEALCLLSCDVLCCAALCRAVLCAVLCCVLCCVVRCAALCCAVLCCALS